MGQLSNLAIYAIVFLVVFVPYAFLQFCLDNPRRKGEKEDLSSLPPIFRACHGLLRMLAGTAGKRLAAMQPKRAKVVGDHLIAAAIRMDKEMVFAAEALFGILGTIVPLLLIMLATKRTDYAVAGGLLCGLVGLCWPAMAVSGAAAKRQELIMKNLPFAIDLVGAAMRAGLDFTASIRYYVSTEKADNPLAVEFGVMLRQMELGKTRVEALEDVAKRVQVEEFNSFAGAVAHGTEIGASIVDTMKIQGEAMRRARFDRAERKAARAPSIMILPIAVFIMPAIFVIIGTPVLIRLSQSGMGGLMK